jgi:phage/plasmid-like protein (TIGR03299 family)
MTTKTREKNQKTVAHRVQDGAPWYGLPSVQNPGDATVEDMMTSAGMLGWNIHLSEVQSGDNVRVDKPQFEVLRNDPRPENDGGLHRLSIVGDRFVPVQNEELESMANAITDGESTLNTVGHWGDGRRVFMAFELGENIVLDPNGQADALGRFLTITAGHDGTAGIVAVTNNLRIACQNQLTANKASALGLIKMRHTESVKGRILAAREALSIAFKQSEVFEQEMKVLLSQSVTDAKFDKIVEAIYPRPEKDVKGALSRWEEKTDTIRGLWNGETCANLDNTAYKAYNALNEHLMWYSTVRAGNVESALVKASGLDDLTNRKNLDLYKKVLTLS